VIVIDASVLVEVLLLTPAGRGIGERLLGRGSRSLALYAPELIDVEVVQILRRYQRRGSLSGERGDLAVEDLRDFPVERLGHRALLARIWELRPNLTAYDAVYVALAEALRAPLLTRDQRLARAPHRALVEVV
jgi:predicted nucleic acid-binding protein